MSTPRPLLLLDVDGPLNPYAAKPHRRPGGYTTHRLSPNGWHGKPLRVWLNPAHGPMLLDFAAARGVDLVWATTWTGDANRLIAPAIGLPELPVIEWEFIAEHWKFGAVADFAVGRRFAWLDDEFGVRSRQRAWFEEIRAEQAAPPHLLHYVDPRIGMTEHDLAAVAAWLESTKEDSCPTP